MIDNPNGVTVRPGMRIMDFAGGDGHLVVEGTVIAVARNGVSYTIDGGDVSRKQLGDIGMADWSTLAICPDRKPAPAAVGKTEPSPTPEPAEADDAESDLKEKLNQLADDWFAVLDNETVEALLLEICGRIPPPMPLDVVVHGMIMAWDTIDAETKGGLLTEALSLSLDKLEPHTLITRKVTRGSQKKRRQQNG